MSASVQTAGAVALLVLMLSSSILSVGPPMTCCFDYSRNEIPRNLLIDFYDTHGMCSQPGIVFITKRKLQLCADPAEQWVQDHINYLKGEEQ